MAPEPSRALGRVVRSLLTLAVAAAVSSTVAAPATADDLDRQRQRVASQLTQSRQDLDESTARLQASAAAVQAAQRQLSAAQAQLRTTRHELRAARAADLVVAAKLKRIQHQLASAVAAVLDGQQKLDAEKLLARNVVRADYQQQTNLLPMAVLLGNESTASLQTRMQWSTTMLSTTQAQIDRLSVLQDQLTARRARQAALEAQVREERAAAAANLVRKEQLERRSVSESAAVATLLRKRAAARAAAAATVAADQREVRALNRERSSVEHRIAVRIAKARAAAARKAAIARAARVAAHKAAARRAEARAHDRQAARKASKRHSTPKHTARKAAPRRRSAPPPKRSSSGHHGFIYPVNGPITSPYGRRFHPVLHIWKLHDGTDFGASCGTPIRAAYSGRVAERYYNGAYGNRLMIDHGVVAGRYVTTGYNHAQGYRVHVGQRVSRGEVIGYVGATGYATGCHLHLMVWLDGHRVNPMSWY